MSVFFKWLIFGWSAVVIGIAGLGTILVVRYGKIKRIDTGDVMLCYVIAFLCWIIPVLVFSILARTLGF